MSGDIAPERLALLLGLSFFFGLAFEEFHAKAAQPRPGGVRTFPLLALAGRAGRPACIRSVANETKSARSAGSCRHPSALRQAAAPADSRA